MSENKKIELDPAIEAAWTQDVRLAVRRMALLYHSMTTNLIAEFGEEKAEELTRKIVWDYGTLCGQAVRDAVLAEGKPLTYENFRSVPDLPSKGWEHGSYTDENGETLTTVSYCPVADYFAQYKTPLARLYCLVDPSKYEGYDPTHTMRHGKHVMDGDEFCLILVEPKE
ncbi:MAG: L-2-amino-thiazoline-4-carboxylic acid hydrolase [Firmicutes bacterium]|jgi:hypothetical protein|nr:L-2-amino-thiazoline-4-carboxylic acid hydrolase [Bacillota bacterium]